MGAKNLKAIAVFGDKPIPTANPERVTNMNKEWVRQMQLPGHFAYNRVRGHAAKKDDYRAMKEIRGLAEGRPGRHHAAFRRQTVKAICFSDADRDPYLQPDKEGLIDQGDCRPAARLTCDRQ